MVPSIHIPLQDSVFNFCIAPNDWDARCGPPPTTYYIIVKKWAELPPDPVEDPRYVGSGSVFVENVPSVVEEKTLRTWLDAGLREHVEGYEGTKLRLMELEEELK